MSRVIGDGTPLREFGNRLPMTKDWLVIVRMSQDNTVHLAEPHRINTWETRVLCGTRIMAEVIVYRPDEVVNVPVYRGRNEYSKCTGCDAKARAS